MFEKMGLTGSIYKTNWPLLILIFLAPLRNIQLQYLPNFGGGLNVINILFFLSVAHAYFHGKKIPNSSFLDTRIVVYTLTSILALIMGYQFLGADANGNWKDLKDQLIPVFIVFVVQRSAADCRAVGRGV